MTHLVGGRRFARDDSILAGAFAGTLAKTGEGGDKAPVFGAVEPAQQRLVLRLAQLAPIFHHGGEDVPLVEVLARRGEVLGVNTLKRRPQRANQGARKRFVVFKEKDRKCSFCNRRFF